MDGMPAATASSGDARASAVADANVGFASSSSSGAAPCAGSPRVVAEPTSFAQLLAARESEKVNVHPMSDSASSQMVGAAASLAREAPPIVVTPPRFDVAAPPPIAALMRPPSPSSPPAMLSPQALQAGFPSQSSFSSSQPGSPTQRRSEPRSGRRSPVAFRQHTPPSPLEFMPGANVGGGPEDEPSAAEPASPSQRKQSKSRHGSTPSAASTPVMSSSFGSRQGATRASYLNTYSRQTSLELYGICSSVSNRGENMDSSSSRSRLRCCEPANQLRRRLAPYCRLMIRTKTFQIIMFMNLLVALFLSDIWIAADISSTLLLDVLLTTVLVAFVFELCVQVVGLTRTYFGGFFFWMDLLGAVSLLMDVTYLPFAAALRGGGGSSADNMMIMRAARIAKLGARAGRFTRLVKLLRFLPGMREVTADAGTAKVISNRLVTALSMRVSCLIIVLVLVMPVFTLLTYPEQDSSTKAWMEILERTAKTKPQQLERQLRKFEHFYKGMRYYPESMHPKASSNLPAETVARLPWIHSIGTLSSSRDLVTFESDSLVCSFNFRKAFELDSQLNICVMGAVMILMVAFSLVLANSVSNIVLSPLEKLLDKVKEMASTIFRSVSDMAGTMREETDENLLDLDDDELSELGDDNSFGNETALLERVVQKLAVLSEITMVKSVVDDETMRGLGEGDQAVIRGFQGNHHHHVPGNVWGTVEEDDEAPDAGILLAQRAMLESAGLSLELLNSWNLNPLELDRARNHAAVIYFVGTQNHGVPFDPIAMGCFLEVAEAGYLKSCTYHNWFHAVDVVHCVYRLLRICACEVYLSGAERYALIVSAVCHDVGHPGLNNVFLIETSHELALRYNDKSPLENMHCAKLFEFMSDPACNIFANLSKPQFHEIRKICIDAILHTDNAHHFSMIKEVQMMYEMNSEILDASREFFGEDPLEFPTEEASECFRKPESRHLLVNLLLHVSDISNSCKPFRICRIWAWQILDEFFLQGDLEKKLGVPVQALNDRDKVNRPFSQIGFVEFLVSPLLYATMRVLPPAVCLPEQMLSNVQMWHQVWLTDVKPPDAERKPVADRIAKLEQKYEAYFDH
eukprot:TRINITY_DN21224_c0_g1_i1.p1 TRINITY_DN21224_c0_g1~~TRINITY_DN21224_c0_g1_i1.p1  ORF type:complete len:1122 (-),score=212.03 TRINITY_DN21224_c0_g1_i1:105-3365(-)